MSATHQLRCTNCSTRIAAESASSNFRCPECGGLYEVIYPWSPGASEMPASPVRLPNPGGMRHLWQERKTSTLPVDDVPALPGWGLLLSGMLFATMVWRRRRL